MRTRLIVFALTALTMLALAGDALAAPHWFGYMH
jgi:hypothetical protein